MSSSGAGSQWAARGPGPLPPRQRTPDYPKRRGAGGQDQGLTGQARVSEWAIHALIIINKAGGLVYQRTFTENGLNQLSTNDYLVLAGTFHGIHAITARLNPHKRPSSPTSRPEVSSGLEVLETENFRMQCFNTLTGTKFLLFTETTQANVDVTMRRVYELYCDYVMKNPFYQLEMPVRCDAFERRLWSYIREINSR
ncbi:related to TRS23 - TRAPP subunit involved in targeting and fusion of ER to golgi transport vesicles [Cephalotrichum gorgonifer]|uniref:Trafficking protein particle complex subunit n=1 Tax=Cephalotrichum gorgonifer TaxID=2041049 RepID=A0AAE8MNH6_9PEZI|nr:related to TRS23 - TRAPP subunit involved in targeting and fusion of ER to golgi transport vesicles [Cephalotrichum gorgonifer]